MQYVFTKTIHLLRRQNIHLTSGREGSRSIIGGASFFSLYPTALTGLEAVDEVLLVFEEEAETCPLWICHYKRTANMLNTTHLLLEACVMCYLEHSEGAFCHCAGIRNIFVIAPCQWLICYGVFSCIVPNNTVTRGKFFVGWLLKCSATSDAHKLRLFLKGFSVQLMGQMFSLLLLWDVKP